MPTGHIVKPFLYNIMLHIWQKQKRCKKISELLLLITYMLWSLKLNKCIDIKRILKKKLFLYTY